MQFLAYSDIHHDDYTNGINLYDTISVEDSISEYASNNNISVVLFGGDWYRATNPTQNVIKHAEAAWVRRSNANIMTIAMPGNHDRWTKSHVSGHAFEGASIFKKDLKHIEVFDEITIRDIGEFEFIFVPSGWENQKIAHKKTKPLVVVFHGLISGSLLASGTKASGIDPNFIKALEPDLVLGADNHTPQSLNEIFGCQAYYLGAPLQHGWGDAGQVRGFWHVKYINDQFICEMVPTITPRFIKRQIPANTEIEALINAMTILNQELDNRPGIIELTIVGNKATELNLNEIERNIISALDYRSRKVRVIADKTFERLEVVKGISEAKTPEDKWNMFVAGGKAPGIDEMDPKLLSEIGVWAIQEAKKLYL